MNLFEKIIAEFSAMTGIKLVPDERQRCMLESSGIFITIQYLQDADEIVVSAPVMDADFDDVAPTKAMYEKALALSYEGNGTSGASLGLSGDKLILSVHLPMMELDASDFGVKLTAFADAAISVRAEIVAAGNAEKATEDATEVSPAAAPVSDELNALLGHFIRV